MDLSMENIEKMIDRMLEKQKKIILKETERLLKEQERSFTAIMSGNMKIITDRLDKLEKGIKNNKTKIDNVEKDVEDMKESLNFQEESITKKISKLNERVENEVQNQRVFEDRLRRNNLRVDGIKESESETWDDVEMKVIKMFESKLGVKDITIERAHRTGMKKNNGRPRTIVMKLLNYKDKVKILKEAKKLKGTNIYINEDFSRATVEIRKKLWAEIKDRREKGRKSFNQV